MPADRAIVAALAAAMIAALSGCSSLRGIDAIGGYVDDSSITSTVKSRIVEDKTVDSQAIAVETSNGNVTLAASRRRPSRRRPRKASRSRSAV